METKTQKKPITDLNDALKKLRNEPAPPRTLEQFNDLMQQDEEAEIAELKKESEQRRKIARPPEAGV